MKDSEKGRVATAVVDRWHSFQNALAGARRGYALRGFLSSRMPRDTISR
jgi:hypothetical protein